MSRKKRNNRDYFSKYICDLNNIAITNPKKEICAKNFIHLGLYSKKENLKNLVENIPSHCFKDKELLSLLLKALDGKFR